ncbi:MAG: hypothetical protein JW395_2404 [Nitrospira sp.]|nr:hypothetical protein [Nitrospira sp.]
MRGVALDSKDIDDAMANGNPGIWKRESPRAAVGFEGTFTTYREP